MDSNALMTVLKSLEQKVDEVWNRESPLLKRIERGYATLVEGIRAGQENRQMKLDALQSAVDQACAMMSDPAEVACGLPLQLIENQDSSELGGGRALVVRGSEMHTNLGSLWGCGSFRENSASVELPGAVTEAAMEKPLETPQSKEELLERRPMDKLPGGARDLRATDDSTGHWWRKSRWIGCAPSGFGSLSRVALLCLKKKPASLGMETFPLPWNLGASRRDQFGVQGSCSVLHCNSEHHHGCVARADFEDREMVDPRRDRLCLSLWVIDGPVERGQWTRMFLNIRASLPQTWSAEEEWPP
jgi:hypothetical protein